MFYFKHPTCIYYVLAKRDQIFCACEIKNLKKYINRKEKLGICVAAPLSLSQKQK